jgi:hypothetical protein
VTIGGAGSSVDDLEFHLVELDGQSRDFGALGDVRLTAVAVDRTGGTVIPPGSEADAPGLTG